MEVARCEYSEYQTAHLTGAVHTEVGRAGGRGALGQYRTDALAQPVLRLAVPLHGGLRDVLRRDADVAHKLAVALEPLAVPAARGNVYIYLYISIYIYL